MNDKKLSLTKALILQAIDRKIVPVDVPEWGGTVYVRQLSVAESDMLRQTCSNMTPIMAAANAIAVSLVDEEGNRLFGDDEMRALEQKNPKAVERIADVVAEINGWMPTSVKDAEKNSQSGPS
jgi:hypothetical protein